MYVWWAAKGGTGTSVTAAGFALARAAAGDDVLIVDLDGDQPTLLGIDAAGDGVAEWCWADESVPVDSLAELEVPVADRVRLLPRGAGPLKPERARLLLQVMAESRRTVVVDAGSDGPPKHIPASARPIVVTRLCFLGLRRIGMIDPGSSLVLVREAGRALGPRDVEAALGQAPSVVVPVDPAVARAVDAGLLVDRLPRSLRRLGVLR